MADNQPMINELQERLELAASFREDVRLLAGDVHDYLQQSDAFLPPQFPVGPARMATIDSMSARYTVPRVTVIAGTIALQLESYETLPRGSDLSSLQKRLDDVRTPRQAARAARRVDSSLRRHDQINAPDLHTLLRISRMAVRADLPLPRYDRLKRFQDLTGANAFTDFWSGQRISY